MNTVAEDGAERGPASEGAPTANAAHQPSARPQTRYYLDHASTSPLRPAAAEAMIPWLRGPAADPGRIYEEGLASRAAIEQARDSVATFLGCRSSREVVFTSGATEAIATAVWGASERGGHHVVSAVEHSAVRLSTEGAGDVTLVGVDGLGRVDVDAVMDAVRPDTAC